MPVMALFVQLMKIYFFQGIVLCSCQSLGENGFLFKKNTENSLDAENVKGPVLCCPPLPPKIASRDLLCFPLKFVVNFIKKHLYYHATFDNWFQLQTEVAFCRTTLFGGEHLWLLNCDLQAFPVIC